MNCTTKARAVNTSAFSREQILVIADHALQDWPGSLQLRRKYWPNWWPCTTSYGLQTTVGFVMGADVASNQHCSEQNWWVNKHYASRFCGQSTLSEHKQNWPFFVHCNVDNFLCRFHHYSHTYIQTWNVGVWVSSLRLTRYQRKVSSIVV